jgi:hypothetical protein
MDTIFRHKVLKMLLNNGTITAALKGDGTIWRWGMGYTGISGDSTPLQVLLP